MPHMVAAIAATVAVMVAMVAVMVARAGRAARVVVKANIVPNRSKLLHNFP
jgi:hypothetical protein